MSRRKKKKPGQPGWWSDTQRIETVSLYLATGSPTAACTAVGVPIDTFNRWRYTDWFKELVSKLKDEETLKLDAKLSKIVTKSLSLVEDRLENGNYQFDQKRGELIRVPVSLKDTAKVATDLLNQQEILRDKPEKLQIEKTIDDRLSKLAQEFKQFASARTIQGEVTFSGKGV